MFSYTYEMRYVDCKNLEEVKTGSVLDLVQDVSIKDSNRAGYDVNTLKEMNLAWLLQGINLKFEKKINPFINVEISTSVKTLKGATSERGCIIKQNGEIVAKTISNWFLFNTEAKKIAKIPPEMLSAYEFYDFDDNFFSFKKLKPINCDDFIYSIKVSNKDIDTNNHLNNQKGADLLMDALPFDFEFNYMNVIYKKQAYLGTELFAYKEETDNGYYVHLMTKEKEICLAGTFENI